MFLLLSSTQKGTHEGQILVIDDQQDTCLRYVKFPVSFQEAELVPLYVAIGACVSPAITMSELNFVFEVARMVKIRSIGVTW